MQVDQCNKWRDLRLLIIKSLEDSLSSEENRILQETLLLNAEARRYYIDYIMVHGSLFQISSDISAELNEVALNDFDKLLFALLKEEKAAPTIKIEKPEKEPVKMLKIQTPPRHVNKFSLYIAIISIAAMVFAAIYVLIAPLPATTVATIKDSIDAQWAQSKHPADIGSELWNNEGIRWLHKGIVKIEFDYGAEVIIEGPTAFEMKDEEKMILHTGRLYATIPKRASGFTVQTPYSTIIDLGTEFGVKVGHDGTTDVHMLKGKASLIPGASRQKGESCELAAGQANCVDTTGEVSEIQIRERSFVRQIDSETGLLWRGEGLNLADVVGGGNGFGTGKIDHIINLDTGRVSARRYDTFKYKPTPGKCLAVSTLPFVDCLFVPDGGVGVDQVSLSGVRFEQCPDTDGHSHGDISNGGIVQHERNRSNKLVLDGVTYGTQQRPAIYIHGNQGITFDLEAIRRSLPGIEIEKFTSLCGISQTVVDDPTYNGGEPNPSFWVLVNGKTRFSKEQVKLYDRASGISIELTEQDRYLSLVVTDGDGADEFDWGVFALPELILRSKTEIENVSNREKES